MGRRKKKPTPKPRNPGRRHPLGITPNVASRKISGLADASAYADLRSVLDEDALREMQRLQFDAPAWAAAAAAASSMGPQYARGLRKGIQMGTLAALARGSYLAQSGDTVHLSAKRIAAGAKSAVSVNYGDHQPGPDPPTPTPAADDAAARPGPDVLADAAEWYGRDVQIGAASLAAPVVIVAGDVMDTALRVQSALGASAKSTAVLINGSANSAGGGWRKGAAAMEENIYRRTSLVVPMLDPYGVLGKDSGEWVYPLPSFGGVWAPSVCVFRGPEAAGYPFLRRPRFVSCIVGWALKAPPVVGSGPDAVLSKRERKTMFTKIVCWLDMAASRMAHATAPRVFVASPIGCGVYGNPVHDIARLFATALAMPRFAAAFDLVVFAAIEPGVSADDDGPSPAYSAFTSVFEPAAPICVYNNADLEPTLAAVFAHEADDPAAGPSNNNADSDQPEPQPS